MAVCAAKPYLQVLVVGAGPVGLCTATALKQEGHSVTVLERRRDIQPVGHALVIPPAAVRALQRLKGAHRAFSNVSVDAVGNVDSKLIGPLSRMYWASLRLLVAPDFFFGRSVEKIDDAGVKPRQQMVVWSNTASNLLTVNRDRDQICDTKNSLPNTGRRSNSLRESIFLTCVPISKIAGDARLAPWLEYGTKHGILGPHRFVLSRSMHGGLLRVQFIDVDHADPGAVDSNWNTPADVGSLRSLFDDFNMPTRAYLEHIDHAEKWQMAIGAKIDTWRSRSGCIVLLGDAAHAMLPHAAQGLIQGIEDAMSLAFMLRGGTQSGDSGVDIPTVTKAWVNLRKPRADIFMKNSMRNAKLWSLPNGVEHQVRDEKIRLMASRPAQDFRGVEMGMIANRHMSEFLKWVRDYDVILEGERAMRMVQSGSKGALVHRCDLRFMARFQV